MADSVMLFPQLLQPTAALKTYAPMSVKFWENHETALDGMKELRRRLVRPPSSRRTGRA